MNSFWRGKAILIFLRSKGLIFLKTKKTGSTSFEIALSRHANLNDVVTPITVKDELIRSELGFPGPRNFQKKSPNSEFKVTNHSTASQVRAFVGENLWKTSQKIAIVRNPFDRIISRYYWDKKNSLQSTGIQDFRRWLVNNTELLAENESIYLQNGVSVLDFAIKYEDLIRDSRDAVSRVGIDPSRFELDLKTIQAKSGIRPKNSSVTVFFGDWPEGRNVVEKHSARELDCLGYTFPE